jgi:hypothetical protein
MSWLESLRRERSRLMATMTSLTEEGLLERVVARGPIYRSVD